MIKQLCYIVIGFCFVQMLHSQEDGVVAFSLPVRNSVKFNRYAINPTFSFVREQNKYLSFTNKREWVQFDNAPQIYLFSYAGRFGENTGAGIGLFQQNYGVLTTFGGVLNYAYNVVLDRDSNLTFGLNLGVYKSGINQGDVVINFPDPSLQNVPSNMLVTINPGINYGTTFLDFGVSLNNLVQYNFKTSKLIEENPKQSVQAHVMYTGYVESRGFFDRSKFSGLVRSEFKKNETVISGIAMLTIPKGLWAQTGYNTLYGLSAGIGINLTSQIALEYNYEKEVGDMATFGSSHEVTLAYKFNKRERYNYSDDDEEEALFTSSRKPKIVKRGVASGVNVDRKAIAAEKAQARAEAAALQKAKEDARKQSIEEARVKAEAASRLKSEQEAQAKLEAETKLKLAQEAQAKEEARLKTEREAQAKAAEENRIRLAEEARVKAEAASKLKSEQEAKAKLEAETKLKLAQEAKAKEEARLKTEQEAQAKAAEENRLRLAEEARVKAEAASRLKSEQEAQAKLEAETKLKLAQEAKAKEEARLKAEQEAQAKAAEENRIRLAEEARVKAEAASKLKSEQEAQQKAAIETEAKEAEVAVETPLPMDETTKSVEALLTKLNETVASKEQDLKDLKQENDLSEQGIQTTPKPFKSVSAENAALESLKVQIDDVIEAQGLKIATLENRYKERLKTVPSAQDSIATIYLNEIEILKAAQAKAKRSKESLVSELEQIKIATEIERKRRIKRAAYDNEEDRYHKDRAALNVIKQTTPESNVPLTEADFDFGEEQSSNIQIVKEVKNVASGYYMVIAVHSDVEKRDAFLTKAVAAGQKNINFFYDVTTSKYYIYYEKFDDIETAINAMETKEKTPYNKKMSLVKIEN
ncbi:PorP/SprF family type IX secretion system membrane protein [Mariniflexile maritimum]|uniref:PorP/SprF family type IX secretion system membrane protein n=1 Tax=Mariniflexile maritimum TaxID=2682493 RepID=UPI0012F6224E|nr:type IX secretion system membrane protein PorP/SprF [Mariniflexile maritimum]